MVLTVLRVAIPAMSTIGYGAGKDEIGVTHWFAGDHRPMRHLGEALAQTSNENELPTIELEDWQIINQSPLTQ